MDFILPQMDDCSISGLSEGGSVRDKVAYFRDLFGLDDTTALLVYQAERLQHKGKLKQARKYYQLVFQKYPTCAYAETNAQVLSELIAEEQQEQQLKDAIRHGPTAKEKQQSVSSHRPIVSEMDVTWSAKENIQFDYLPEPDECAFHQAQSELSCKGYGNSMLVLLKNEVLEDVCNYETGWETFLRGRARFRVTLIPDVESAIEKEMSEAFFRSMMKRKDEKQPDSQKNKPVQTKTATASGGNIPESVPTATQPNLPFQCDGDRGSTSSTFADAESNGLSQA